MKSLKRVYVVVGIDLFGEYNDNDEIDNVLNEMDYSFKHKDILNAEIVENQFQYNRID